MVSFRRSSLALSAVCICVLAFASAALAAGPASVTVRVEGAEETLVAPTEVTTTTAPVVKDGNPADSCQGTSAAGALELATAGNWSGSWFSGLGYSVETIAGESHLFEAGAPANYFWSFWLDNKPASTGICEAELQPGDSLLFFPECFSETGACPPPPNPLGIVAPEVAETGSPVTVKVTSYANASGAPAPAAGASVTGGEASATTDANGEATLTFPSPGAYVLQASAPDSVRTEAIVCIHNANDGSCGTSGSSGSAGSSGGSSSGGVLGFSSSSYKGPYAVVAKLAGLIDNHHYPKGHAPRVLAGKVLAHTGVASVSLRLRRSYRGRCYAYKGASTRFGPAHCGDGSFFKVGTQASFSYLLPEALAPGRYVLDVEATDAAGNRTTLARGTSRIVFYVR
jgi:hypothetical protein